MQLEDYFPLGIARGKAFIGRDEDLKWLQKNIVSGVHSLLLAPRRYGKSSLVLHALEKGNINYVEIDLQLCRSAKSVEKKIIRGVEKIITNTISEKEKVLRAAKAFLKKNNKQWKIGLKGFVELTIEPDGYDDVPENILMAFQFLDATLAEEDKRAIIFIDEIQEISQIESFTEIQGAIRHFAQKTSRLVFIFSGSNRRILRHMFNDRSMPFYQLCDTITLDKIPESIYVNYFQKIAKITWDQPLSDEVISEIFKLSQCHPRRVYNLCLYVWRLAEIRKKIPMVVNVQEAWKKLVNAEAKNIRYFLAQRNNSQLKTLGYIALCSKVGLTGKATQKATDLSSTAITNALRQLEQDDVIEHCEDGSYNIIDPVIKDVISTYEIDLIYT